jgi:hypothetical protein
MQYMDGTHFSHGRGRKFKSCIAQTTFGVAGK